MSLVEPTPRADDLEVLAEIITGALDDALSVLRGEVEARADYAGRPPGDVTVLLARVRQEFGVALRRRLAQSVERNHHP